MAVGSICNYSLKAIKICIQRGDNQARPTVIDSRSILAGVQGFESLSPHSNQFMHSGFMMSFWESVCPYVNMSKVYSRWMSVWESWG